MQQRFNEVASGAGVGVDPTGSVGLDAVDLTFFWTSGSFASSKASSIVAQHSLVGVTPMQPSMVERDLINSSSSFSDFLSNLQFVINCSQADI